MFSTRLLSDPLTGYAEIGCDLALGAKSGLSPATARRFSLLFP